MFLFIDTSDGDRFTVGLVSANGGIAASRTVQSKFTQSEKLLPSIVALLTAEQQPLPQLRGIIVVSGPGGFTSLRVGISTANALSYGLEIPVVGVQKRPGRGMASLARKGAAQIATAQKQSIVLPQYGSEPNITKPKKNAFRT
ncbi:MAG: tRNA (adenosine(37)-N6)-threonylcarbamoyltransferase complex dimerization subunit type 1 TsaB [Patescibacteria group bacterium]